MTKKHLKKIAEIKQSIENHIKVSPHVKTIYLWEKDFIFLEQEGKKDISTDFKHRGYTIKKYAGLK